jgi:hypothetical protein
MSLSIGSRHRNHRAELRQLKVTGSRLPQNKTCELYASVYVQNAVKNSNITTTSLADDAKLRRELDATYPVNDNLNPIDAA